MREIRHFNTYTEILHDGLTGANLKPNVILAAAAITACAFWTPPPGTTAAHTLSATQIP